jgi:hypothetical protein
MFVSLRSSFILEVSIKLTQTVDEEVAGVVVVLVVHSFQAVALVVVVVHGSHWVEALVVVVVVVVHGSHSVEAAGVVVVVVVDVHGSHSVATVVVVALVVVCGMGQFEYAAGSEGEIYSCGPGTGRDRGGKAGDDDSGTHFDIGWSVRKRSKRW